MVLPRMMGAMRRLEKTFGRLVGAALAVVLSACADAQPERGSEEDYAQAREELVRRYLETGVFGRTPIRDEGVLRAMRTVPRHLFVPVGMRGAAYEDQPLPIGQDQTISQPYVVATMTEALLPHSDHVVLEVGTGSGYQAAVLGEIVARVYSIEIVRELGERAAGTLQELGYENVEVRVGDGYKGWPEHAPFDGIIVTAAPDHVPQPLIEQLKPGGRMVIPVGPQMSVQELRLIEKQADGTLRESTIDLVRFVPMTGEAQDNKR